MKKCMLATVLSTLLFGCGSDDSGEAPKAKPSPSLHGFNLTAIDSANTAGSSGSIRQAKFSWESAVNQGVAGVTYTLCEKDTTKTNDCLEVVSVNDSTEAVVELPSLLEAVDNEYFVMASKDGKTQRSNERGVGADELSAMIGYFKASNTDAGDYFGSSVALSADGHTLAVGAQREDSSATGINGEQGFNDNSESGAVYVYRFDGSRWAQEAYVKASNAEAKDGFGQSVALSADGNLLVVGADGEDSDAKGINGDSSLNKATDSGAVYVYRFGGSHWEQEAYIKASNTEASDYFGRSVSLSADGSSLAVGAWGESSGAKGINGDETLNNAKHSGAVYIYRYAGNQWVQEAYVKASNTEADDLFGQAVVLSANGITLAVGARGEDSSATGVNGNEYSSGAAYSGAVYLYRHDGSQWAQEAYVKASNTEADDNFGTALALSADGNTLVVGATGENSSAVGINGNQSLNDAQWAGALYVYRYDGKNWAQQAYIKASNTRFHDSFGWSVSLSADGHTLAIGATGESSSATGINGDQQLDDSISSGAVYVYRYDGGKWGQKAYVKASNADSGDTLSNQFGQSVALSADGQALAVGAHGEDSGVKGINGNQRLIDASASGAVYLY